MKVKVKSKENKKINNLFIKEVSERIDNPMYNQNIILTKQLIELFDRISMKYKQDLRTANDYADFYNNSFYSYKNFKDLVTSEKEQNDGLTENEIRKCLENQIIIYRLPCGIYVQYV